MIIAVAHNKGGVGKTTFTINFAPRINPDILIDMDQHDGLTVLNNMRPENHYNVVKYKDRQQLIETLKLSREGKTIIVDCGGFDLDENRIAVAAADVVIVPFEYDSQTERIGLNAYHKVLGEISRQMNKHIVGHVLYYRVHPSRKNFADTDPFVERSEHLARFNNVIPGRKEYNQALRTGLSVLEHPATRSSRAARELHRFCDELIDML